MAEKRITLEFKVPKIRAQEVAVLPLPDKVKSKVLQHIVAQAAKHKDRDWSDTWDDTWEETWEEIWDEAI